MKSLQTNIISQHNIQTETYQENHLIICEFVDTYHGIAITYADFFSLICISSYMLIKFRRDFYLWVFNFTIFLQLRKAKLKAKLSTSKVAL